MTCTIGSKGRESVEEALALVAVCFRFVCGDSLLIGLLPNPTQQQDYSPLQYICSTPHHHHHISPPSSLNTLLLWSHFVTCLSLCRLLRSLFLTSLHSSSLRLSSTSLFDQSACLSPLSSIVFSPAMSELKATLSYGVLFKRVSDVEPAVCSLPLPSTLHCYPLMASLLISSLSLSLLFSLSCLER